MLPIQDSGPRVEPALYALYPLVRAIPVLQPLRLKMHPSLAAAAVRHRWDGALFVWTLARALDPDGRGLIAQTVLTETAVTLGGSQRQVRRWLAQAQQRGLLTPCILKRFPQPLWRIRSLKQAARQAGLSCLTGRPVWLPALPLHQCKYRRAGLWAVWQAGQQREQAPI